jgi:hypothetical protein
VNDSTEIRFAFETAIDVIDGLSARAFLRDSAGDARVLATTNELVHSILVAQLGEGSARA